MRASERLIRYAKIHTTSDENNSEHTPSTRRQFELSRVLEAELKELGFQQVSVDEHAYVYGMLPASPGCEGRPTVALIAHLDTAPDYPGENVRPQLVPDYDGGEIPLGTSGRVLSPEMFPDLRNRIGHTLITTDGTTLLGADDKAGISEIITACEEILREALPHGGIAVCFTPDEEIGHGAELLKLDRLGADYGYTVDGSEIETVNCETFNAAAAELKFTGVSVHPGDAKNRMKNAARIAMEFDGLLPAAERPEHTEDHEGFFHLTEMQGSTEQAVLRYIIRDHDAARFDVRKAIMEQAAKHLNEKYGEGTVTLCLRDQYRNMEEQLREHPEAVERAEKAIRSVGLEPRRIPIRGGTDGAQLSFRGLPCPNLGTGGAAFHGPYEHISVEDMDTMTEILKKLLTED
ncbi:MAG: peptidase T [Oscillospiraceae bacterium]|nr:peptidase T [Oscillospiraceae bacterium]